MESPNPSAQIIAELDDILAWDNEKDVFNDTSDFAD